MTSFLHLVRTSVISIEALILLAATVTWVFFSDYTAHFDKSIAGLAWWSISPLVPLVATNIVFINQILFPKENAQDLIEWKRYPQLRTTAFVSLVWIPFGIALAVLSLTQLVNEIHGLSPVFFVVGYLIPLISTFSCLMASLTIRSLLMDGR